MAMLLKMNGDTNESLWSNINHTVSMRITTMLLLVNGDVNDVNFVMKNTDQMALSQFINRYPNMTGNTACQQLSSWPSCHNTCQPNLGPITDMI